MFNHSVLLDMAKARNAEMVHEVEMSRISRGLKPNRTANRFVKKLRSLLSMKA
jgi:hypothetical protein